MHRRSALLLLTLLLACDSLPGRQQPRARHIFLISIDTLRSDRVGAYGYTKGKTPNIDALAKEAVLYERAYAHSPLTLPSHATMLTGLLPADHELRDNIGFRMRGDVKSLPELLKQKGYETGAVISAFVLRKESGIARGFDFYDDKIRERAGASLGGIQRSGLESIAISKEWISARTDRPFFFFLHLYEPHSPYNAPEPYRSAVAEPYDAEVTQADALVGDFIGFLKEQKLYDDSLIVLVSDHGEGLGDHGEAEHGIFLYREAIQVPLLIKLPRIRKSRREPAPVQLLDLAPTILARAGVVPDSALAGSNLLAAGDSRSPRQIYSESFYPRLHFGWSDVHSLIEGERHYIEAPKPELYDLASDPAERHNLKDSERRVFTAMRKSIASRIRPVATPASIDPEEARKLAALGYLGGTASVSANEILPDPKDKTETFRQLQSAFALFREGRDEEALRFFRQILVENPRMVDVWEVTAKVLSRLGRTEEAIETTRRGLTVAPQSLSLAMMMTNLLIENARLDEAARHVDLIMKREPGKAHEMLARIELARGNLDRAETEARAAMNGEEKVMALVTLGRIKREKKDFNGALSHLDQALAAASKSQKPPVVGLQYLRGDTLARLGREAEAETALRAEMELAPADSRAYQSLILLLITSNRLEEATRLVYQLIEAAPTLQSFQAVARTLKVVGDEKGARYWARRGLKQYPNDRELRALAV